MKKRKVLLTRSIVAVLLSFFVCGVSYADRTIKIKIPKALKYVEIVADHVNLRESPSASAPKLYWGDEGCASELYYGAKAVTPGDYVAQAGKGERFEVVAVVGDWYRILYSRGTMPYVVQRFCRELPLSEKRPTTAEIEEDAWSVVVRTGRYKGFRISDNSNEVEGRPGIHIGCAVPGFSGDFIYEEIYPELDEQASAAISVVPENRPDYSGRYRILFNKSVAESDTDPVSGETFFSGRIDWRKLTVAQLETVLDVLVRAGEYLAQDYADYELSATPVAYDTVTLTVKDAPVAVASVPEQAAEYPGGQAALMRYVASNVRYPAGAMNRNEQGRVLVRFCVQADGTVGNVSVQRGVSPELDAEAVRVVKSVKGFRPARAGGRAVASWFTLPVTFRLSR